MKQYFVDTNVIVYANDRRSKKKQSRAIETIGRLMRGQNGEDLNEGQFYAGMQAVNPFKAAFDPAVLSD